MLGDKKDRSLEGGVLLVGEVGLLVFDDLLVLLNIRNKDRNSFKVINFGVPAVECLDLPPLSSLGGLRIEVNLKDEVSFTLLETSGSSLKSPVLVR